MIKKLANELISENISENIPYKTWEEYFKNINFDKRKDEIEKERIDTIIAKRRVELVQYLKEKYPEEFI